MLRFRTLCLMISVVMLLAFAAPEVEAGLFRKRCHRRKQACYSYCQVERCGIPAPIAFNESAMDDLSGYWRTGSGAEYEIRYEADYLIALYWNPSPPQRASGFKRGDLAYKGTLVGRVLVGTFYQRFPLDTRERCPGMWERPTTLYLQVSEDSNRLSGTLLEEHLPDDSCVIDDRRLSALVFERIADEKKGAERVSGNAIKRVP